MKRHVALVISALVVIAAAGAGVGAWLLARGHGSALPRISAYSRGTTVRVEPYLYCNVVDLNDCVKGGAQGRLSVATRYPVQVSLPPEISRAPWRLLRIYEDEQDTETAYRPGTSQAVTIPTVDARHGRIVGVVVQLLTLVRDEAGELHDLPHAEWSLQLVWD